jgi:hypothetical protein
MLVSEIEWHEQHALITIKDLGLLSLHEMGGEYRGYIYPSGHRASDCYTQDIDLLTLACLIVNAEPYHGED